VGETLVVRRTGFPVPVTSATVCWFLSLRNGNTSVVEMLFPELAGVERAARASGDRPDPLEDFFAWGVQLLRVS